MKKFRDLKTARKRWVHWRSHHRHKLEEIYESQNGKCGLCNIWVPMADRGAHTTYGKNGNHATFDHIVPLSKGGNIYKDNIRMLCFECNTQLGKWLNPKRKLLVDNNV